MSLITKKNIRSIENIKQDSNRQNYNKYIHKIHQGYNRTICTSTTTVQVTGFSVSATNNVSSQIILLKLICNRGIY